ncbi:hypothetical protein GCM10017784_40000 [Deinococcus indicus]|uniref:restriction endonuclease subunit S n=1 Tax=Deinococcus indicus TaxID=223556 RepID=UPI00174CFBC7|nr:restriction endonuclease subunit S [Deinococcus indicus]GHG41141.1 hypothetical protein GCM10017784_40000 [Deinococcus indicus]
MTYGKDNFPEIPDSWISILVGESQETQGNSEKIKAKDYLDSGLFPIVDQGAKHIGGYSNDAEKLINNAGSVIVFGDHTRHIKYIDFPFIPGADGTKILQPNAFCHPKTFYYFLRAIDLPARGYGRHFQFLRDSIIPLPPLAEQVRIADKLDALLARVEAGRERLERVPKLLKRFRQSVLSAAVSGDLTREWRGGNDHAWITATIGSFGAAILGRQRSPKYHSGANMRPYLRVQNVFEDLIDTNDVMEMVFDDKDYKTYRLEYGDILLNEGQSPHLLGRPAMFRNEIEDACFTNTLIRFRAGPDVVPEFALYTFRHYMHSGVFRGEGAITTNIAHLGLGRFTSLQMSVPPLAEQAEIIRRVESLFAIADRIEAKYAAALSSFDRLTPALLAKAFRGELVPQDPNDEPASVLLERICAAREAEDGKRGRGRPAKAAAGSGDGAEVKRRGRPPGANARAGGEGAEPKRRGRPPKARAAVSEPDARPAAVPEAVEASAAPRGRGRPPGAGIPQASSFEDALRKLEAQKLARMQGTRQVGLFGDTED